MQGKATPSLPLGWFSASGSLRPAQPPRAFVFAAEPGSLRAVHGSESSGSAALGRCVSGSQSRRKGHGAAATHPTGQDEVAAELRRTQESCRASSCSNH